MRTLSPDEVFYIEVDVTEAIHRLERLPSPKIRDFEDRAALRLMQEYLQRMACWSRALGTNKFWAFGDFAAALDLPRIALPEGEVIDPCDYDAWVPQLLQKAVEAANRRSREQLVLRGYAHWIAVREMQAVRNDPRWAALEDPYEPMLRLLERGSMFNVENGIVDVGDFGVVRGMPQDWPKRRLPELSSFSDDALDAFDQAQRDEASSKRS